MTNQKGTQFGLLIVNDSTIALPRICACCSDIAGHLGAIKLHTAGQNLGRTVHLTLNIPICAFCSNHNATISRAIRHWFIWTLSGFFVIPFIWCLGFEKIIAPTNQLSMLISELFLYIALLILYYLLLRPNTWLSKLPALRPECVEYEDPASVGFGENGKWGLRMLNKTFAEKVATSNLGEFSWVTDEKGTWGREYAVRNLWREYWRMLLLSPITVGFAMGFGYWISLG